MGTKRKETRIRESMLSKKFDKVYSEPNNAPWTFSEIHKEVKDLIGKKVLKKGMRVLEIGCGEGHHAIFLAKKGMKVTAVDRSANAIRFAKANAKKKEVNVILLIRDFRNIGTIKKKFDFIFDWRFAHELTVRYFRGDI